MSEVPQVLRDVYIARYAEERIVAGTAVRLNDVDGYFTHPAIAPDAKRAAYWGRCRGRLGLWAADLSVRRVTLLPIGAGMACHPAWSPDARCLAYAANQRHSGCDGEGSLYNAHRFAPRDIWTMDIESGTRNKVTDNRLDNERPAWSPDGRRLAYVSTAGGCQEIRICDLRAGTECCVTSGLPACYRPAWHPAGHCLAFNNKGPGNHYIWLTDANGAAPRRLTPESPRGVTVHDHGACWSADGGTIMFHSDRGGQWGLWLIGVDGGNIRPVNAAGMRGIGHATWDAAAAMICFDAGRG